MSPRSARRRTRAPVEEPETGVAPVRDSVDRIVAEWADERPDLPVGPIEVITRLSRVRIHLDEELARVFVPHGLTAADFTVIAALRRAGTPYALPQSILMNRLRLTSGTVSVRLGQLESKGIVTRAPSDDDGRGVLVTLTPKGVELFDGVAPEHLANEELLLSALTQDERGLLADLLRKLLVAFEHPETRCPLGFSTRSAHLARRARAAVGLSDTAGLLVSAVDATGPAAAAGLRTGDLVLAADGHPVVSCVTLAETTDAARGARRPLILTVLRRDERTEITLRDFGEGDA